MLPQRQMEAAILIGLRPIGVLQRPITSTHGCSSSAMTIKVPAIRSSSSGCVPSGLFNLRHKRILLAMKQIKLLLFFILMYLAGQSRLQAQETVSASGGNATGTTGSMSYTVGQVFYSSVTGTNSKVAEGVQQPYDIFRVTSSRENMGLSETVSVYPNPTTEHMFIKFKTPINKGLSYQLFNTQGQLLTGKTINSSQTIISMDSYVPSIYYIKIFQNHKEVTSFKIIKK